LIERERDRERKEGRKKELHCAIYRTDEKGRERPLGGRDGVREDARMPGTQTDLQARRQ